MCQKGELRILQLSVSFLPRSLLFYRQMFSTCCVKKYVLPGLVRLRMLLCYVLTGEAMGTVTGTRHLTSPKWLMKQLNDNSYWSDFRCFIFCSVVSHSPFFFSVASEHLDYDFFARNCLYHLCLAPSRKTLAFIALIFWVLLLQTLKFF